MAVVVKVGPWGAPRGEACDIPGDSMPQSLVSITICSAELPDGPILGFSFVYVDQNGRAIHVAPWGTVDRGAGWITNIKMGADKYLYRLSGTANDADGVSSHKLVTNLCEYMVGLEVGSPFIVPLQNGRVVAFFGRCDNTLRALGIYVPVMLGSPVKIGPWGGSGGAQVDISTPVQLKSVTIYSTPGRDGRIWGFSFTYIDLTGQPIITDTWGTSTRGQKQTFPMNQGEYVNDIAGTADDNGVTSLKFTTNQVREYGPYGREMGNAFSVPLPDDSKVDGRDDKGAVVGFFGQKGDSLVALGIYVGLPPNPEP